ncbi:MAG: DUF4343 domain-containing protein [Verrucomicrobiaceae bacterium]|nr:MAG: DUF4343 domain-containing protein [Verrucomicrobiaceae bacterium]
MFRQAFLQQLGNNRLRVEEQLVLEECERRGIHTKLYLVKHVQRQHIPIDRGCFICGDMDVIHGAMRLLGIDPPSADDFPTMLEPFLHRRVWRSSVPWLEEALHAGREVFAKPAGRRKYFTGRAFSAPDDLYHLSGISRHEPLWCSEVVRWLSEYRVYVVHHQIVGVAHYAGDPQAPLDMEEVRSAVAAYAGTAPSGYGIDFGVLDTGRTALVEVNDGYALGAYRQVDSASYTTLLFTRWEQLLKTASNPAPAPHV